MFLHLEESFHRNDTSDDRRVKLVTNHLHDRANIWWRQLKKHNVCANQNEIFDRWNSIKKSAYFLLLSKDDRK